MMVTCDCWEVNQSLRVYLKYVSVRGGALSMEMDGRLGTHKLHVDNWDMKVLKDYLRRHIIKMQKKHP